MKQIFTFILMLLPALAMAQGGQYTGTGYYRVQNKDTKRYMSIWDNKASISGTTVDFGAFRTLKGFEQQVVSNPATICYFEHISGNVNGTSRANLMGQGLNLYNLVGIYLDIYYNNSAGADYTYTLSGKKSPASLTLQDSQASDDEVDIKNLRTKGGLSYWYLLPVNDADGQYFGLKPDVQVSTTEYWGTVYAGFPFRPKTEGTKIYTVRVAEGYAIVKEVTGDVPMNAPVLFRCVSDQPTNNRLNLLNSTSASLGSTAMKGNWYNYNNVDNTFQPGDDGYYLDHYNRTAYNPTTMRMLDVVDGKAAFVKSATLDFLPANKAYLQVSADAPDVLPIVTEAEYAAIIAEREKDNVTLTANSYSRLYGDANPAFEYTVSGTGTLKGQPVISCEATATSPVGTYPIVIAKGTVSNYKQSYVNGTLTITQAPLTITAGTYTKKQGEAMPTFAVTYSGFKNGETASVLTKQPVISCEATAASAPGEYPITVSGAEAQNYGISYVAGKLVVTAADPVTVTANSYTREYGEENPVFGFTATGAALDGTPEITCEATATSPVGTYPIVIKKGGVKNYNDTYVNGVLTITQAPLTITAGTYTKKQGEAMPTFAVTYSGFKNGETESVLTKQPVISCEATVASAPGEYPITVSGAEAQNYGISYVAGKLVVTDADPVTVTANSYTREYGEENPVFDFTTTGAALDGTPEITCEATATSPVGTYPIVIKKGGVKNYNDTYVNGVLTITQATLTAKVGDYERHVGEENPAFAVTYTGWKNGEDESVLIVKPVATTEATTESPEGEYDIVVSGGEAQNYRFEYVNGVLTVLEASGIAGIMADGQAMNVYSLSGTLIRAKAQTLEGLAKGVYIVNGRKVVVK